MDEGNTAKLVKRVGAAGVDALRIGRASRDRLEITAAEHQVSALLADAERAWRSLPERLEAA